MYKQQIYNWFLHEKENSCIMVQKADSSQTPAFPTPPLPARKSTGAQGEIRFGTTTPGFQSNFFCSGAINRSLCVLYTLEGLKPGNPLYIVFCTKTSEIIYILVLLTPTHVSHHLSQGAPAAQNIWQEHPTILLQSGTPRQKCALAQQKHQT